MFHTQLTIIECFKNVKMHKYKFVIFGTLWDPKGSKLLPFDRTSFLFCHCNIDELVGSNAVK